MKDTENKYFKFHRL